MFDQAKNDFQAGKPILIYHNEENESALTIPAEHLTEENYQFLRKVATGDVAVMLGQDIAQKLGMHLLSDAFEAMERNDDLVQDAVKPSHAGPTFDLTSVKTGSADMDKIQAIKRFADLVLNQEYNLFAQKFVIPGHVRTYLAKKGLLDERLGHTELGVFFSRFSGLSGVVCMVTVRDSKDGHPLNKEESEAFAKEHNLNIVYEEEILDIFRNWKEESETTGDLPANEYLQRYMKLRLIRRFEEKLEELFRSEKIRGSYHLAVGQEATGVALGEVLNSNDCVFVTHRGHHIALGLGVDYIKLFFECIGDSRGLNQGKAGPMHFSDRGSSLWMANGIVAANAGISAGVALSRKLDNSEGIVVNVIGEGSLDEGVAHEALTLASLWQLPIVILCENNLYSQTTKLKDHIPTEDLARQIEEGYGITTEKIAFGTDLNHLTNRLTEITNWVRQNKKPVFVEVMTYRFSGHSMSDTKQEYKIIETDMEWKQKDPIELYEKYLLDNQIVHKEDMEKINEQVENKIKELENELH